MLPLFLSATEPKWLLAQKLLAELSGSSAQSPALTVGRLFGQSYFAVEALADRFRAIHEPAGRDVIVVGHGATDADSRQRLEADWQRLADLAAQGFGFKSVKSLVWPRRSPSQDSELEAGVKRDFAEAAKAGARVTVVPFALGSKLDSMMNFNAMLQSRLPAGAEFIDGDLTPHPVVSTWMAREWNRGVPLRPKDFGVVFLAHGSDFHWNETMRENVAPLAERFKIEFAFAWPTSRRSNAPSAGSAVRAPSCRARLRLAASFKSDVEHMLGQDADDALLSRPATASTVPAGHDHGQHAHTQPPPLPTPPPTVTAAITVPSPVRRRASARRRIVDRRGGITAISPPALLDRASVCTTRPRNCAFSSRTAPPTIPATITGHFVRCRADARTAARAAFAPSRPARGA